MNYKAIILIMMAGALAMSCEKTINYEIPREPNKLTIQSKILTDQPITVLVGSTQYILDNTTPSYIEDAKVVLIEDDVNIVDQNLEYKGYYYHSDYIPKAGKKYTIEVEKAGFTKAYGSDYTLAPVPVEKLEIDSINFGFKISFRDPPGRGDYYRISAYQVFQGVKNFFYMATSDPLVDFFYDYDDDIFSNDKYGDIAFTTDDGVDGQLRTISFKNLSFAFDPNGNDSIYVELARISEDFYKHERSKGNQYINGDNPFSEPVQIHSNIENGYGIVGGGGADIIKVF